MDVAADIVEPHPETWDPDNVPPPHCFTSGDFPCFKKSHTSGYSYFEIPSQWCQAEGSPYTRTQANSAPHTAFSEISKRRVEHSVGLYLAAVQWRHASRSRMLSAHNGPLSQRRIPPVWPR